MRRLATEAEAAAIADFIDYVGEHRGDDCVVLYRDDDGGTTWYQVVDAHGHGDGSGEWTPIEDDTFAWDDVTA